MENNRHEDRNYRDHNEYNDRWDEHADRDKYERNYYQNHGWERPQGYSYNAERDRQGMADFNRYGTGYTGNDYDRYGTRYGYDENNGGRYDPENNPSRQYRGAGGYSGNYGTDYGREYNDDLSSGYRNGENRKTYSRNRGGSNDRFGDRSRDWWDRTTDEVASWFGDDDAERRRRRDRMYDNNHHGKGPKGYQRSDERIKEDLQDNLYNDSYIDASDMEVIVNDGKVTLSGSVESKLAKRRAEDMADVISGVKDVQNNLTIKPKNDNDYYSNQGTGTMTSNTSHKTNSGDNINSKKKTTV